MSSPSQAPTVSVIVPARDAAEHVTTAISSALAQPPVGEVVVAVADDATRAAVEAIGDDRVKLVDNPDGTTPAALNRALRVASGEVIVRCDAQSVLPEGYVERAMEILDGTGAANVGGRQVPVGVTAFERAVAMAMVSPAGAGNARYRIGGAAGPTDTVYLGVFQRSAMDAVNGFSESLLRNQDYELNVRLRDKGGIVWFDPDLAVEYRPRGSPLGLWRQYFQYGFWKRVVLRRHPGSLRWRQLAPPALVVVMAGSVVTALAGWRAAFVVPGLYLAGTVAAAAYDGVRHRDLAAGLEPVALWVMHFGWGTGFIAGLLSGRR